MVQAPGVSHATYTVEISAGNTTGTFSVTMGWFDLEPPTNLKSNGDSRSATNRGQAVVEWTDAPIDTGYSIRYQEYCDVGPCSTWTTQTVPEGANSYTIANLTLSQLCTIQMDTIVAAHIPDWTDPDSVYVYPTSPSRLTMPGVGGYVGPVRMWNQPTYSDYRYIICLNTLPADDPTTGANERLLIINGIVSSLEAWETATHRFVMTTRTRHDSSACGSNNNYQTRTANTIEVVIDNDIVMRCGGPASACADPNSRSDADENAGRMAHVKINLNMDLFDPFC